MEILEPELLEDQSKILLQPLKNNHIDGVITGQPSLWSFQIQFQCFFKPLNIHNCMAAADKAVVLLELDVQWDLARTH